MQAPVKSGETALVGLIGLVSMFPAVDAGVVFGAFAGGAVFVLSAREAGWPARVLYLLASVVAGCISARMTAGIIDWILPDPIDVPAGLGALVASAVAVRALQWAIKRAENPDSLASWGGFKK